MVRRTDDGWEFCELERDWTGVKYTHHPVLAALELQKLRSFRHLRVEEMAHLVARFAPVRQSPFVNDYDGLADVAVKMDGARRAIQAVGGISCIACTGMVWPRQKEPDDSWSGIFDLYDGLRHAISGQFRYTDDSEYFCDQCFPAVRSSQLVADVGWKHVQLAALHAVLVDEIVRRWGFRRCDEALLTYHKPWLVKRRRKGRKNAISKYPAESMSP